MPYRSHNFEDAYVLTQTGASKLEADQLFPFHVDKLGLEFGKDRFTSFFPSKFTNEQLSHIDTDGVVKVGTKLTHGSPIIL